MVFCLLFANNCPKTIMSTAFYVYRKMESPNIIGICVKKEKQNRGDSTFPYLVSIMKKPIQQIKTYKSLFDFRFAKLRNTFDSAMINLKNLSKKFHDSQTAMHIPVVQQFGQAYL